MFLFKASGKTYRHVVANSTHAFRSSPKFKHQGELVLLSKNKADCANTEKQIQNVGKILRLHPTADLESMFPGVHAEERWTAAVQLYWVRPLEQPFNLSDINGFGWLRYQTVQDYAAFSDEDEKLIVQYLCDTNPVLVMDILNNAVAPGEEE